ncbi:hypothetical protein HK096_006288 [Nowakowskiella sp. JEL0078]|nr:hypothetical protein HK096_006288 [Nowakowskiella sp. JEL0078]
MNYFLRKSNTTLTKLYGFSKSSYLAFTALNHSGLQICQFSVSRLQRDETTIPTKSEDPFLTIQTEKKNVLESNLNSKLESAFKIGDLVEVKRPRNQKAVGIIIQVPSTRSFTNSQFRTVLSNGHTIDHFSMDITFRYPQWCYSQAYLREPIEGTFMTTGLTETTKQLLMQFDIPICTLHHLGKFQGAITGYVINNNVRLKKIHEHFGLMSESAFSLEEITRWVFGKDKEAGLNVTAGEMFAVHSFLGGDNLRYEWSIGKGYTFRDPREIKKIAWLQNQIVNSGDKKLDKQYLDTFVSKCRSIIEWRRWTEERDRNENVENVKETKVKALETLKNLEPQEPKNVTFTKHDLVFINAMKQYVSEKSKVSSPHEVIALKGILKMLEPLYPNKSTKLHVILFLKEIGIWAPWENVPFLNELSGNDERSPVNLEGSSSWAEEMINISNAIAEDLLKMEPFDTGKEILSNKLKQTQCNSPKNLKSTEKPTIENVKHILESNPSPSELHPSLLLSLDENLYTSDTCAALRHDFGNLPVYVIDAPGAHELDDGISIETKNGDTWVHVHIADPTTYIPPTHPLSLFAQLRGTSIYLPERHYPMLPEVLAHARFDLGASSYALTFSARLGSDGDIIDYKVTPSILRNIVYVTYKAVDGVLDWDRATRSLQISDLPYAKRILPKTHITDPSQPPPTDPVTINELRSLAKLAECHYDMRLANGGFHFEVPAYDLNVTPNPLPITPAAPTYPQHFAAATAPQISLDPTAGSIQTPSHSLVSECMVIAGRVAAKFATERAIPVPYRGQPSIHEAAALAGNVTDDMYTISAPRLLKVDPSKFYPSVRELDSLVTETLRKRDAVTGVLPFSGFREIASLLGGATVGLVPHAHFAMGLPGISHIAGTNDGKDFSVVDSKFMGYVKVTSPLRRYKDLLAHWQIKSWLVADASGAPQRLPFAKREMGEVAALVFDRERRINKIQKRSERYWAKEWVRRRELWWQSGLQRSVEGEWAADGPLSLGSLNPLDLGNEFISSFKNSPIYSGVVENIQSAGFDEPGVPVSVLLDEAGGLSARLERGTSRVARVGEVLKCIVTRVNPTSGFLEVKIAE